MSIFKSRGSCFTCGKKLTEKQWAETRCPRCDSARTTAELIFDKIEKSNIYPATTIADELDEESREEMIQLIVNCLLQKYL